MILRILFVWVIALSCYGVNAWAIIPSPLSQGVYTVTVTPGGGDNLPMDALSFAFSDSVSALNASKLINNAYRKTEVEEVGKGKSLSRRTNAVNTPMVEYHKLSSSRYLVRIRGLEKGVPLVFNETFDRGWKLYLLPVYGEGGGKDVKKQMEGSSGDKGAGRFEGVWRVEPGRFVGFLPSHFMLSDKCSENANLSIDFSCYTLGKGSFGTMAVLWPDSFHWKANGYANSWWIDPRLIRKTNLLGSRCFFENNHSGGVDAVFLVEFVAQKFFVIGCFLSSMTFLGIIIYMIGMFVPKCFTGLLGSDERQVDKGKS